MRKLLLGCGIAAALCVVALIVGGMVLSSWFKSKFPETDRIEKTQAELRQRFGDPDRFTPPLDGSLPPDRLEIFVTLRESLATRRDSAAVGLARFVRATQRQRAEGRSRIERVLDVVSLARGGADMTGGMLRYFNERQQMLLDAGMGDGEYAYWQALTALSWLGWDPFANPQVEQVLQETDMRGDVTELRQKLLRTYRRQLGNLRGDLEAKRSRTPAEEQMLRRVATELDASRSVDAAPFAASFPPEWAAALAPYRTRIESTLPSAPAAVVLDLALLESDGRHFRFDWRERSRSGTGR